MLSKLTLISILAIIPITSWAATACPIEKAHYKYGWPGETANFEMTKNISGKSRLALHLSLAKGGDLWFFFDQGSSRYISLISTENVRSPDWTPPDPDSRKDRPIADQRFFAWNSDSKILVEAPVKGNPAPEFFLIPDLPETLQFQANNAVTIGSGIYRFDHCE